MIPTKIFFQIHDSRRLLITYWLINDFLSGHVVSFCKVSVSGVRTSVFIQTRDHHSFCLGMELFCIWSLSTSYWRNKWTVSPESTNYIGGAGACSPAKFFENWSLGNAISCIPWIERSLFIRVFCWAFLRVSLFMIPKPKYKDSWFPFHPRLQRTTGNSFNS